MSKLRYDEVQKDSYEQTFSKEKDNLKQQNQKRKEQAYIKSKPTFAEGAKTTATAATIEGTMSLCMAIAEKKKDGRKVSEFSEGDWKDIVGSAGKGTLKGSIFTKQ